MRKFELTESAKLNKVFNGMENDIKRQHIYQPPQRQTPQSAGYDFYSPCEYVIQPGGVAIINTGYKAYMLPDEYILLAIRSSLGFAGLSLLNYFGVIDADYVDNETNEGEISFRIKNDTDEVYIIKQGDRIGQGMFMKYILVDDDMPVRLKRKGPSGSTGR